MRCEKNWYLFWYRNSPYQLGEHFPASLSIRRLLGRRSLVGISVSWWHVITLILLECPKPVWDPQVLELWEVPEELKPTEPEVDGRDTWKLWRGPQPTSMSVEQAAKQPPLPELRHPARVAQGKAATLGLGTKPKCKFILVLTSMEDLFLRGHFRRRCGGAFHASVQIYNREWSFGQPWFAKNRWQPRPSRTDAVTWPGYSRQADRPIRPCKHRPQRRKTGRTRTVGERIAVTSKVKWLLNEALGRAPVPKWSNKPWRAMRGVEEPQYRDGDPIRWNLNESIFGGFVYD